MYKLIRINDLSIKVKGNNVYINDIFDDITNKEIEVIVTYLEREGFINSNEINVHLLPTIWGEMRINKSYETKRLRK